MSIHLKWRLMCEYIGDRTTSKSCKDSGVLKGVYGYGQLLVNPRISSDDLVKFKADIRWSCF